MKPFFKCEFDYVPSPHLSQIYDGFEKLRKIGIVETIIKRTSTHQNKPLLNVLVNNRYKFVYDTLDGLNWISGSIEDNLKYYRENIRADFYFKRSCNKQIRDNAPLNCMVYPLGMNFSFQPEGKYPKMFYDSFVHLSRHNLIFEKFYKKTTFYYKDFEYYPIPSKKNKILFLTRLWDPDEVKSNHLKEERKFINKTRIDCIKSCQKEFGNNFIGGLQHDSYLNIESKDLKMPFSITKKESFLNVIKESNICIATTGLHNSIGWKFGEYVAASRAILSEPLEYEIPGDFEENKNYFVFKKENELMNKVHFLLKNRDVIFDMMNNNYNYYNNFLRSDKLVLNTLLKIHEND